VFLPARAYAAKRTAGDSIAACRASWSTGNTRRLATTLAWAKFFSQGSDDANTRTPQHKTVSKRRRDLESSLPTFQEHTFTFTTHSITAVAEGERPSSILR
jgi:hypothetical protein